VFSVKSCNHAIRKCARERRRGDTRVMRVMKVMKVIRVIMAIQGGRGSRGH